MALTSASVHADGPSKVMVASASNATLREAHSGMYVIFTFWMLLVITLLINL